jgi:hypothetical protein
MFGTLMLAMAATVQPVHSAGARDPIIDVHANSSILATTVSIAANAAQSISPSSSQRDGQRDFDWEFGAWGTSVRVLRNPLTGAPPNWVVYEGTSIVKPLMDGKANFVELSVKNASGAIEGGALRLYNPQARQWSLNFASLRNGLLTAPVFGGFDSNGRGSFVGQDQLDGRTILVRFIITRPSPSEARFEQSYSADGGQTWETNWIAIDKRQ